MRRLSHCWLPSVRTRNVMEGKLNGKAREKQEDYEIAARLRKERRMEW